MKFIVRSDPALGVRSWQEEHQLCKVPPRGLLRMPTSVPPLDGTQETRVFQFQLFPSRPDCARNTEARQEQGPHAPAATRQDTAPFTPRTFTFLATLCSPLPTDSPSHLRVGALLPAPAGQTSSMGNPSSKCDQDLLLELFDEQSPHQGQETSDGLQP